MGLRYIDKTILEIMDRKIHYNYNLLDFSIIFNYFLINLAEKYS